MRHTPMYLQFPYTVIVAYPDSTVITLNCLHVLMFQIYDALHAFHMPNQQLNL